MAKAFSVQDHEYSAAIEAALKETARGQAFLADYAQRVQQSNSLSILAMLSRLERVSDDLASRLAQLEKTGTLAVGGNRPPRSNAMPIRDQTTSDPADDLGALIADVAKLSPHLTSGDRHIMERIEAVAATLGDLRRTSIGLAAQFDNANPIHSDGNSQSISPGQDMRSRSQAIDLEDDEVLGEIAEALGQSSDVCRSLEP
ncbi:hypothetical protein [Rhodopseudomonas sp. B29]|uniref:hypothetical protein n=1 Tax=Rhodopseudomonas sp. B29 TaxID=95607 RepID=UPI00034536E9|nr:hypothetical protein [Rhodopseudomonas sp. B29]